MHMIYEIFSCALMERCAVGYISNTYTHIIQRLVFGVTASEMVRKILQDLDKRKYFGL